MKIFDDDDPLVRNGTYDTHGYKPGERARIAKARARQQQLEVEMAKKRGRPRNVDLPGMDDRRIKALDDVAASYADIRDRRMELTKDEAELKQTAIKLMHKHDKTIYKHDGIEIRLVPGDEDVKVKVKKDDTHDDVDDVEIGDEADGQHAEP